MPKLHPLDRDQMSDHQRDVYDTIAASPRGGVRGPFPALLRNPELAARTADLGGVIRYGTSFSPRLLELAVLVTARSVRCDLEWHAHSAAGLQEGLSPALIEAIRTDAVPPFADSDERAVYEFVCEVRERHRVSDRVWSEVRTRFGEVGVVELAAIVGYFCMVATSINAHGLVWAPDLPPAFDDDPDTMPNVMPSV